MKTKQKIIALVIVVSLAVGIGVYAPIAGAASCGGVETSIIDRPQTGGEGTSSKNSGIWGILLLALNIMTAGVGILAVGGIVYGAILYSGAAENASQIQKAKGIIKNVIVGLVAYGAMYMLLNFLIPGGIFT